MPSKKLILYTAAVVVCLIAIITIVASTAPGDFPAGRAIQIESGQTLNQAAETLRRERVIRSTILFKAYAVLLDKGNAGVKTGEYLFARAESALKVAYRLVRGQEGFPLRKVTIPEGSSSGDIASLLKKAIPAFDAKGFAMMAKADEGYLFPETYFWPENVSPEKAISDMKATFEVKTRSLGADTASSSRKWSDVVIMASIIEREATSSDDRRIISGILWKRLDDGMALQVDAPFYYILHKPSNELTLDDLRTDSPYNLYTHTGLTPKPIANPGLDSMMAALEPAKTKYWYYLSDKKGGMHYAVSLEDHAYNKNKYLY